MRRFDREFSDKKAVEDFISREQILRIAFYDDGDIYIVPVNYGYVCENDVYTFFFHGAKAGRKYELAKSEPTVGFEIDGKYKLLTGEKACDYSASFQSVIGTGILKLVEDVDEKKAGLDALMKQCAHVPKWDYNQKMIDLTAVFRLDVQKMSCKAK